MKESKTNIAQSGIIFKEPFLSESHTVDIGGTATDVTYNADGTATFNGSSSRIEYPNQSAFERGISSFSVRVRFKTTDTAGSLIASRVTSTNGWGFEIGASKLTTYIQGVDGNSGVIRGDTEIDDDIWHEGVLVVTQTTANFYLDGEADGDHSFAAVGNINWTTLERIGQASFNGDYNGDLDLVEIYDYALTASEIWNMYSSRTNRALTGASEQLGSDLMSGYNFQDGVWVISGTGTIDSSTQFTSTGGVSGIRKTGIITTGKTYKVVINGTTDNATLNIYGYGGGDVGLVSCGFGTHYFIAVDTGIRLNANSVTTINTTQFELYEVLHPSITVLSDYNSKQGYSQDLYNPTLSDGGTVNYKRVGSIYSAEFNGSTSKIDMGSSIVRSQTVLWMAWFKSDYPAVTACLIANNKSGVFIREGIFYFTRDASGSPIATYPSSRKNKWTYIAILSEGTGTYRYTMWFGDTKIAPYSLLSGTHAIPVTPTTNDFIGSGDGKWLSGNAPEIRVEQHGSYDATIALRRATQFWQNSRKNYS